MELRTTAHGHTVLVGRRYVALRYHLTIANWYSSTSYHVGPDRYVFDDLSEMVQLQCAVFQKL